MKKIVATIQYLVDSDYRDNAGPESEAVGTKLNEMKCRNGFESLSAALANAAMMIKEAEGIMSNRSTFDVYTYDDERHNTIFEVRGCGYVFRGVLETMVPPVTIED